MVVKKKEINLKRSSKPIQKTPRIGKPRQGRPSLKMMCHLARERIAAKKLRNDRDQLLENLNFQKKAKSTIKPIFKTYKITRDNDGVPMPHKCDRVIENEDTPDGN